MVLDIVVEKEQDGHVDAFQPAVARNPRACAEEMPCGSRFA
jgi:hypothetical protein